MDLQDKYNKLKAEQSKTPSADYFDPNYRRLYYCRYADDFVLGFIGSKAEAEEIKGLISEYIRDELHLKLSEEKTKIVNSKDGMEFLGYGVTIKSTSRITTNIRFGSPYTRRSYSRRVQLSVPHHKIVGFAYKNGYGVFTTTERGHFPHHRNLLQNCSDTEIVRTYNAELRGFANYYSLAWEVKAKLSRLFYLAEYSYYKTLARKYRTSLPKVIIKLRASKGKPADKFLTLARWTQKEGKVYATDKLASTWVFRNNRTELQSRWSASRCEWCGASRVKVLLEMHHPSRIKNIHPLKSEWSKFVIARRRKVIPLCHTCHDIIENPSRELPDRNYHKPDSRLK